MGRFGPFKNLDALSSLYGHGPSKLLQFLTLNRGNCFSGFPVAHPVEEADAAFRDLIFEDEIQRMQDSLEFLNLSLNEMIPFDGEPVALGTPTSEGEKGKEFLHNSPILLNQFSLEADHLG